MELEMAVDMTQLPADRFQAGGVECGSSDLGV